MGAGQVNWGSPSADPSDAHREHPKSPFPSHSQIFDPSAVADFLGFLCAKVSNAISASEAGATPVQSFCYCIELNTDGNTTFV